MDGSKVQEHFSIIPTKTTSSNSTIDGLAPEERNIYFEILNTTLAMFHSDYVYEETKVITDVNGLEFETTGNTEISKGCKCQVAPNTHEIVFSGLFFVCFPFYRHLAYGR